MSETIAKFSVPNRTFFLNKDINAKSVQDVILGIHEINRLDDEESKDKIKFTRKPIKIILDTNGGEIYRGMALANTIETSTTDVHIYIYGIAASFGVILAAVAQKTFAHKRATFMLHQLSAGMWGTYKDMEESMEQRLKLQNMLEEIIMENSNITKEELLEVRNK